MSSGPPQDLGADFLDDFYAECDEHLTAIRHGLTSLDHSVGRAEPDAAVVEKLFRNFHSFKGNAAIVGLRPAEELAHAAEDFLRQLSRGGAMVSTKGLDLLMSATQRLEQMVASHRAGENLPNATALCDALREISGTDAPPATTQSVPASEDSVQATLESKVEVARAQGKTLWQFRFSPHRDLDLRGVNVNSVRQRIARYGEILQSTPHVDSASSIVFEFIAALNETPADLAAWEADGIHVQPFESVAREPRPEQSDASSDTAAGPFVAPSHVVRVDLSRLDELMRITGEMVIHRARLDDQISRLLRPGAQTDPRSLQEISTALARDLRELREGIMRVRLVPVSEIFSRMPFVVRDLARDSNKQIRLTLTGQQTEIDKYIVERLKDPLLHLVRNCISHGIELPDERTAAGKDLQATIFLRASTTGDSVLIEMGDDGRGIDAEFVVRRAVEQGLPISSELNPNAILNLICQPGFSTRSETDRAAGRGVGMSVVQSVVRELGGTLALDSTPGKGTRFSLRLPLTLAIADVFIVSANELICAVPQSFVQEVLPLEPDAIRRIGGTEVIPYRDGILPLFRLRDMFRIDAALTSSQTVLVLRSERGSIGLAVDRIHGQREVVVRAIRDPLIQVPGVAGATELGDGRPVLILDAAELTSGVVRPNPGETPGARNTFAVAI